MFVPILSSDTTAIITAAGLMNACEITGRRREDMKVVLNGPGAAGIATLELIKAMGVRHENVIAVDSKGVLYRGRTESMNQYKSAHAVETDARTLAEAVAGADVFFGLSVKGALTPAMVMSMAEKPIIFAMANPDPEITPEEVHAVRSDAIVATGLLATIAYGYRMWWTRRPAAGALNHAPAPGPAHDLGHDGSGGGDGPAAQVVTVGEAARNHDGIDAAVVDGDDDPGLEGAAVDQGVEGRVDAPRVGPGRALVEQVLPVVHVQHREAPPGLAQVGRRQVHAHRALRALGPPAPRPLPAAAVPLSLRSSRVSRPA